MRSFLPIPAMLVLSLAALAIGEELKPDDALAQIRALEWKIAAGHKYVFEAAPARESFVFSHEKDEVVWTRTYGKDRNVTQVFSIEKDRASLKQGAVKIPLRWVSIDNPTKVDYQPDKHDVGLRITKTDAKWNVRFYAIDAQGQELALNFVPVNSPPNAIPAENTAAGEILAAVRNLDLKLAPGQKYANQIVPVKELFTFDQGVDEVVWVRTYQQQGRVTQVYSIVREKATIKNGVATVPLRWKSIHDPAKFYNPDKHDVGLRISKGKADNKWTVRLYAIDTAGNEVELKFREED